MRVLLADTIITGWILASGTAILGQADHAASLARRAWDETAARWRNSRPRGTHARTQTPGASPPLAPGLDGAQVEAWPPTRLAAPAEGSGRRGNSPAPVTPVTGAGPLTLVYPRLDAAQLQRVRDALLALPARPVNGRLLGSLPRRHTGAPNWDPASLPATPAPEMRGPQRAWDPGDGILELPLVPRFYRAYLAGLAETAVAS